MSDSVQPHRRQPTRLCHPWDSPGKNTGVGCHFLLQCMKVKSESEVAQLCPTLCDPTDCSPPGSSVHGTFQARVLVWAAIAFSRFQDATAAAKSLQCVRLLCDPIDGSLPGSANPWDSPGKNTGVGCHFLLQSMKVERESEVAEFCPTLRDPMNCSPPGSPILGFARQEYWSGMPLPL